MYGDDYFSADDFLYTRCCVLANGQETYEDVLAHPKKMPKDLTFEALLTVIPKAYELKTGKKDYFPITEFSHESLSNRQAW